MEQRKIIGSIITRYLENKNVKITSDYKMAIKSTVKNTITKDIFIKNEKNYKVYCTYEMIDLIVSKLKL